MKNLAKARLDIFAALVLALTMFFAGFARLPLSSVDAAHRASMARNVVESGQTFPPYYQGKPLPDHPPLYIWSIAALFKIFGYSDAAASFPGRFCAVLTVLLTALLALKCGYGARTALAAAFILCFTRDFILGSTRGYIEPMLDVFFYGGFWFALHFKQTRQSWAAAASGICVFLAAFTKGPVAAWPLLLYPAIFAWGSKGNGARVARALGAYLVAIAACVALWALWVESRGDWLYWKEYWQTQVMGSAVGGRAYAQTYDPYFFLDILRRYYWPWLPLLLWGIVKKVRGWRGLDESVFLLVFALGFVGAFSLVRFKFWYYISPAYPAFALFIAASYRDFIERRLGHPKLASWLASACVACFLAISVFPIRLHRDRVPEVAAFRHTIRNSPLTLAVYVLRPSHDYNLIEKAGNWYFERNLREIVDDHRWEATDLRNPGWVITSREFWESCERPWCKSSTLVQTAGSAVLVYAINNEVTRTPR